MRDEGIEIDAGFEEKPNESEEGSSKKQKADKTDKDTAEAVKGTTSGNNEDTTELSDRDKSRDGAEGSEGHPRNRYDPKNDDIVARQLREAAEEETDPELRKKLWKEYEQYKKR